MSTTTELTEQYISEHRSIKDCLVKGLVNYSALARRIAKELDITNKTSMEAILIAARRYKQKVRDVSQENGIRQLFQTSNMDIKNNIIIFTLDKYIYPDNMIDIERTIKKPKGLFYVIEGAKTINVIVQEENRNLIKSGFGEHIMKVKDNLSLITVDNPKFEGTPGIFNYISGLLFEREINIEVAVAVYGNVMIIIDSKDLVKVIQFFNSR